MKALSLLAVLFCALPARSAIVSSIARLDLGAPPITSLDLAYSTNPLFPTFTQRWQVWSDYTFQFRDIPSYLQGADQIRTKYATDATDADFQLQVTLNAPAVVYLLIDNRTPNVETSMPWVAAMGFTDTGDDLSIQISDNSPVLTTASIYRGTFEAGNLVLLQQNSGVNVSSMYTVAVAVPEPAVAGLLGCGTLIALRRRRTRDAS